MINIEIGVNEENQRLDKFLKKYLGNAPLSYIYKAIRKDVKLNGRRAKEDTVIRSGDILTLYITDDELSKLTKKRKVSGAKRQFKVAYEDDKIIVVEKPFGVLTHGDSTEKKNHLANQVVDYLIEKGDYNPRIERTFTPASVNRLDRNTTGLVLFGKTNSALQDLNRMIREKDKVNKYYMTIVRGTVKNELHLMDRMVKDNRLNKVTVVSMDQEGRDMETIVRPLESKNGYTLVEVEIITGRTHQIRAHLAKAGHPLIGDVKYGDKKINELVRKKYGLSTQLLHAYRLSFQNCSGQLEYLNDLEVISELPENFNRIKQGVFGI